MIYHALPRTMEMAEVSLPYSPWYVDLAND
jgi:hypothetical protein